ncbi:hypothetical protein KI387_007743, partial [Taxus chinensis]
ANSGYTIHNGPDGDHFKDLYEVGISQYPAEWEVFSWGDSFMPVMRENYRHRSLTEEEGEGEHIAGFEPKFSVE